MNSALKKFLIIAFCIIIILIILLISHYEYTKFKKLNNTIIVSFDEINKPIKLDEYTIYIYHINSEPFVIIPNYKRIYPIMHPGANTMMLSNNITNLPKTFKISPLTGIISSYNSITSLSNINKFIADLGNKQTEFYVYAPENISIQVIQTDKNLIITKI